MRPEAGLAAEKTEGRSSRAGKPCGPVREKRFGWGGWVRARAAALPLLGACLVCSLFTGSACSTVEPGQDFQIADIVFDEDFYYCSVEPVLFASSCGSGSGSDPSGGCHYNVTNFRLTDYTPRLGDSCQNGSPTQLPGEEARNNYSRAQSQMRRDPDLAPLFNRPTGTAAHPRRIFEPNSPEALVIRDWAERFSSQ